MQRAVVASVGVQTETTSSTEAEGAERRSRAGVAGRADHSSSPVDREREATTMEQIQAELSTMELSRAFFAENPEMRDQKEPYVVRLRYRGPTPQNFNRDWVKFVFLERGLRLANLYDVVKDVIELPGIPEIDVGFWTEAGYLYFWRRCRAVLDTEGEGLLADLVLIPQFRGNTKVVTLSFQTLEIPPEDVTYWLRQRCQVISEANYHDDHHGYMNQFRAIVALERDPITGCIRHLPKYLFMGRDRGVVRYVGQPAACEKCGSYYHVRDDCRTNMCALCGETAHDTVTCGSQPKCSLGVGDQQDRPGGLREEEEARARGAGTQQPGAAHLGGLPPGTWSTQGAAGSAAAAAAVAEEREDTSGKEMRVQQGTAAASGRKRKGMTSPPPPSSK